MAYADLSSSRNGKVLDSFIAYCVAHPSERFWQALLNWSGVGFILASGIPLNELIMVDVVPGIVKDTYNWEGRNG